METLTSIFPGFPTYFYGSLLLILLGGIFYVFMRRAKDDTAEDTEGITEIKEEINNINGKLDKLIEVIIASKDDTSKYYQ